MNRKPDTLQKESWGGKSQFEILFELYFSLRRNKVKTSNENLSKILLEKKWKIIRGYNEENNTARDDENDEQKED